jgi:hypothetical protein
MKNGLLLVWSYMDVYRFLEVVAERGRTYLYRKNRKETTREKKKEGKL